MLINKTNELIRLLRNAPFSPFFLVREVIYNKINPYREKIPTIMYDSKSKDYNSREILIMKMIFIILRFTVKLLSRNKKKKI